MSRIDEARRYFGADFWNLASLEYDAARTQRECEYLVQRLNILSPRRRILDICCGVGRHAAGLALAGFEVTGIDWDPDTLSKARRAASSARFVEGDAFAAELLRLGTFDGAILIQSCGWTGDGTMLAMLRQVRRTLAADGVLILDMSPSPWIYRNFVEEASFTDLEQRRYDFHRRLDADTGEVAGELVITDHCGERRYPHRVRLYDIPAMRRRVIEAGFEILAVDADFEVGAAATLETRYAQLVCRAAKPRRGGAYGGGHSAVADGLLDLRFFSDEPRFAAPPGCQAWNDAHAAMEGWGDARAYYAEDPFGRRLAPALARALEVDILPKQMIGAAGITSLLAGCARLASGRTLIWGAADHPDFARMAAPFSERQLVLERIDVDSLRTVLDKCEDAIVMIQRPPMLGKMIATSAINELAAAFPRALFVIDEAYMPYGETAQSAAASALAGETILVLCGLSKGFGAGGLRVGFALGSRALIADLEDWIAPLQLATPSTIAAEALLNAAAGLNALRMSARDAKANAADALAAAGVELLDTDDAAPWICCRAPGAEQLGWFAQRGVVVRALSDGVGRPAVRLFPPLEPDRMSKLTIRLAA